MLDAQWQSELGSSKDSYLVIPFQQQQQQLLFHSADIAAEPAPGSEHA